MELFARLRIFADDLALRNSKTHEEFGKVNRYGPRYQAAAGIVH